MLVKRAKERPPIVGEEDDGGPAGHLVDVADDEHLAMEGQSWMESEGTDSMRNVKSMRALGMRPFGHGARNAWGRRATRPLKGFCAYDRHGLLLPGGQGRGEGGETLLGGKRSTDEATMLGTKTTADVTGQKLLTRFIELLAYKEVVLKSDGEPALVKMKTAAGKAAKCTAKVVNEECPAGDSRANGEAEAAAREIKWRCRAIHFMVQRKFGIKLTEMHPLMTWVPRNAAEQANRFKVGVDGKTAEEQRTAKR